jgi:hypothetical protein
MIERLDQQLARLIGANWKGFLGHARLATNGIGDATRQLRLHPTRDRRLWVVVFDGMRWDTWARHVRPRLLESFELVEQEKAYLSLLPSWTRIARTGLLAGRPPGNWFSRMRRPTRSQEELFAIHFNIQRDQLQFFSAMEADGKYELAREERFPFNVLVFNISDDNLHAQRGSLTELNKVVNTLLDNILQMLDNLITPNDTMIITSDHGFMRLYDDAATVVDEHDDTVRYRYLIGHPLPQDTPNTFRVSFQNSTEAFTVPIGRTWFRRADVRPGAEDTYAHGGLSFAEMSVPRAVLRRIVVPKIDCEFRASPDRLDLTEGTEATVTLLFENTGNRHLRGELHAQFTGGLAELRVLLDLQPGERSRRSFTFVAPNAVGRQSVSGALVLAKFSYTDFNGQPRTKTQRIPVNIAIRTDTVAYDLGDLPDLDI